MGFRHEMEWHQHVPRRLKGSKIIVEINDDDIKVSVMVNRFIKVTPEEDKAIRQVQDTIAKLFDADENSIKHSKEIV